MEYPKIETLFNRDPNNLKQVVIGDWRLPEFTLIDRWLVTEKIDGTNVRVLLTGDGTVRFGGRTDNAQMPVKLLDRLSELLPQDKVAAAFDPGTTAVMYGEGFGASIQSGGDYSASQEFALFDVCVIDAFNKTWWLNWDDVEDVARKLGVRTVPILGRRVSTTDAVAEFTVRPSLIAEKPRLAEGIVCRTDPLLFDRRGHRVMWKLKLSDVSVPALLKEPDAQAALGSIPRIPANTEGGGLSDDEWQDDFGTLIGNVHHRSACEGRPCVIHHPSDHPLVGMKLKWRQAGPLDVKPSHFERICEHGVGHPDPDSAAWLLDAHGVDVGVHGCDGCCSR